VLEAFNALYSIDRPGEIIDVPFKWKRETYHDFNSKKQNSQTVINGKIQHEAAPSLHTFKKPVFWGITAGAALLTVYFLILTIANSFNHSIEQFRDMWYWITPLIFGFGVQAGLYTYIREAIKLRKEKGAAVSSVAAAGGISTTSMVACCAHHVTDVLPILGVSAAVVFLNQFQNLFLTLGILSNIIGISLMLRIIQKHGLYQKEQKIFSLLMKLDMSRSFYLVSALSVFVFVVTLYISI
jgi:hypothetical protein